MTLPDEGAHPAMSRLEAVAAGDAPGKKIAAHLEACEMCAAHVARLKGEAAVFRAQVDPTAFAEAIRLREEWNRPRRSASILWVGPALAAAAAVLLWLHVPPHEPPASDRGAVTSEVPAGDKARFKGGLVVAAIRERRGQQERLTGPFEVQPSDRIRIEIAIDHEGPVTAGLLSNDGTWTVLEAPTALGAGTHYSDLAARFDDTPTDALLLVGAPEDVERARTARNFEHVVAWRVTSSPAEKRPMP